VDGRDEVLGSGGEFTHATIIDVPIADLVRPPPSVPWTIAGSMAELPRRQ
jgi:hypothetical protein